MNQQPPTNIQNPSVNGTTSDDIQYVPYYAVHPPLVTNNNTTPSSQQPTIYPWSGINQIPFNFIPPTIPSVVHSDVELQQVPITQNLIPSSNNTTQLPQVTSPAATNTSNSFRSFFSKWRNCKHSQQRRFLKSLKSKTWTRIPRAVGVFSLLFIILSIAFFLTIGKSADNNLLNYRKGMCNINTDQDNSIVHFDYEHGMYYLELNVSVAHRNMGPGGPDHDDLHTNRPPQHNYIEHKMKLDFPKNSRGSFILSRVCAYPIQQQTLDCRDRVTKYGEISCYIDEERMRLMEMMEMFHNFEKSYKKGKEGKEGKPSNGEQQQPPRGERRALEESTKQEGHRESRNKYLEDVVATRQTVGRRFRRSLRCNIPGFLIASVVAIVIFIIVGFKVLDGKSRRSCDRFIRQYFANPFEGTGEVYKLDEVSSSAIVIQDPNEPKHRTLLSSSTLKMENTPHQERILQKRLSKFWKLMRSTATKATESLLLYEKPAKKNISCHHGKKHGACQGKRKIGRILCVLVKVALILFVVGLITYGAIHTGVSIFRLKIFSGFLNFYFTLGVIALITWFALFKRRSVHYLITSERIAKVIELPLRLRMNLISVSYDKIKGVWAEENRIYLKTVNSKGVERSGMIFEHVVDPVYVVHLIKQQIEPNTTESAVETQQD